MNIIPNEFLEDTNFEFKAALLKALDIKIIEGIEIEIRVGQIFDKFTGERLIIKSMHPIIFQSSSPDMIFKSGIPNNVFTNIYNRVKSLILKTLDDNEDPALAKQNNLNEDFLIDKGIESIVKERVVLHDNGRFVYKGHEVTESIKKEKIANYNVYFPEKEYDLRLSISHEKKINFDKRLINKKAKNFCIRERDRRQILMKDYSFDFTKVLNDKKIEYEIEVEVKNYNYDKEEFIKILLNLI